VSNSRTPRGFSIAGRPIGLDAPPFIISEMSGNHNHSLERALQIVDAAAKAGAHGFKIQTYTAETMTLELDSGEFRIDDPKSLWHGRTLYSLYAEAATPWEWHEPLFERARKQGMIPFSTPFDDSAVEFLEKLASPCYKVASFENTDLALVRRIAATKKPMIISTGMATVAELEETVVAAREGGCNDIVLLKCTSTYPAKPENTNIATIPHMRELFRCEVGLSDHTMGVGASVASVALGATVIEKHFTLSRADGGVDSAFSLEPAEMHSLVVETERAWQALGDIRYGATAAEKASLQFRRSLYVGEDIPAGKPFNKQNLRRIRPGNGLAPRHYEFLLGKVLVRAVKKGEPVSWDMIVPAS
jgi:pseudaminic acid synthase